MLELGHQLWRATPLPTHQEQYRALADKLYEEAQRNPQSPYAGKKVGIANGQVVVVADGWDEIVRALEQVAPDAPKTFCIDMAQDYKTVQHIWEARSSPAPTGL